MTEERVDPKLADAFRGLEPGPGPRRGWTPEEVFDAVHGKASRERLAELVDMSVDDAELADAFRVARAVRLAGDGAVAGSAHARARPGLLSRSRVLVTLATAAAAVAGVVWLAPRDDVAGMQTSELRSGQTYEIAAESGGELPRDGFELKWTRGPAGTRYFVEAMDGELNVLFTRKSLETHSVTVPADSLAGVAAGAPVIWRVEAYLDDGRTVRSPTFRTTLAD